MRLAANEKKNQTHQEIRDLNVIDLILIDHRFLKKCINVFASAESDKNLKLNQARSFLAALSLHGKSERKAVYQPLRNHPELHFMLLESEKNHQEFDTKIKTLKRRFNNTVYLREEVEEDLRLLAELVSHHIAEEENEILPSMNEYVDDETLRDLGCLFMTERKFTHQDLKDYPGPQDDLIQWKDNIQKISSEFLAKTEKFTENLQH